MPQCESNTRSGERCKNVCSGQFCHIHTNTTQCAVCLLPMSQTNSRRLDCGHTFHLNCIDRWKRRSHTCPMCRAPFDLPMYRIKVTIEPDGQTMERVTSNLTSISDVFGLEMNNLENFFTDIRFAVHNMDILNEILREIGFGSTSSNLSSTNTVGTTEL